MGVGRLSSAVAKVFKTLAMVPVAIAAVFLVFNLFGYITSYFRLLGLSYMVQSIIVENNYIPTAEQVMLANGSVGACAGNCVLSGRDTNGDGALEGVLASYETSILRNVRIVHGDGTRNNCPFQRKQYGGTCVVQIAADYVWAVPFMPQQVEVDTSRYDDSRLNTQIITDGHDGVTAIENGVVTPMVISYTLPGLAYYPDLAN